jgi:trans-2,3-dihydro-3-hydroxyanthranilate isomerase
LRRKFYTLDVFTDTALAGNPLAVVLDSDGLDDQRMQAIAREFNLSETVFVFPPADPVSTARVRIFTPARELPFAGHPTIGTAVLLGELRAAEMLMRQDVGIVLEEKVGNVACTVRHAPGEAARASFVLPRLPEAGAPLGPKAAIARALGIGAADIDFGNHVASRYSAGVPFAFVPVASRAVLAKINVDRGAWLEAFVEDGRVPAFVYCNQPLSRAHHFRARMFATAFGIAEDPATGSAAAAFAGVIQRFGTPADGSHTFIIEQGFEMGRPSLITLGLDFTAGKITAGSIGGSAVILMQGILDA